MSRPPDGDEQLQEWAAQRLDGEIDDQRWELLLQSHPQTLEQALQEHRRIGDAIRAQARPAADPLLRQAILARIPWANTTAAAAAVSPRRPRTWHPARWISAAALAACLLVALHLEQRSSAANAELGTHVASNSLPQRPPADVIDATHEPEAPLVAAADQPRGHEESSSNPAPHAADAQAPAPRSLGGVEEHQERTIVAIASPEKVTQRASPAASTAVASSSAPSPNAPGADEAAAPPTAMEPAAAPSPAPSPASSGLALLPFREATSPAAPASHSASKDLAANASSRPVAVPDQDHHEIRAIAPVDSAGEQTGNDDKAQVASTAGPSSDAPPGNAKAGPASLSSTAWRVGLTFAATSAPATLQVLIRHPAGASAIPAHGLSLIGLDLHGQLVWKQALDAPTEAQPVDEAHPYRLTVPLVDRLLPPATVASISLQMPGCRSAAIALPSSAVPAEPQATSPAAGSGIAPAR